MKKIGFIGVGIMGKSMVRNLMKAGDLHSDQGKGGGCDRRGRDLAGYGEGLCAG